MPSEYWASWWWYPCVDLELCLFIARSDWNQWLLLDTWRSGNCSNIHLICRHSCKLNVSLKGRITICTVNLVKSVTPVYVKLRNSSGVASERKVNQAIICYRQRKNPKRISHLELRRLWEGTQHNFRLERKWIRQKLMGNHLSILSNVFLIHLWWHTPILRKSLFSKQMPHMLGWVQFCIKNKMMCESHWFREQERFFQWAEYHSQSKHIESSVKRTWLNHQLFFYFTVTVFL